MQRAEDRKLLRSASREHWIARLFACGWFGYIAAAAHWNPSSVVHFVIEVDGAQNYALAVGAALIACLMAVDLVVGDILPDQVRWCWCGLLPWLPRRQWACQERALSLRVDGLRRQRNLIYTVGAMVQVAPVFVAAFYGRVNWVAAAWYCYVALLLLLLSTSNTYRLLRRARARPA